MKHFMEIRHLRYKTGDNMSAALVEALEIARVEDCELILHFDRFVIPVSPLSTDKGLLQRLVNELECWSAFDDARKAKTGV